jgi:hypothetical protein
VDQELELGSVVGQPGQVEQPLIDHSGVTADLELHNDGRAVLVDAERVDPAAVPRSGTVFARQESHAQERLHVALARARGDFHRVSRTDVEQFQTRHLPLLTLVQPQRLTGGNIVSEKVCTGQRAFAELPGV